MLNTTFIYILCYLLVVLLFAVFIILNRKRYLEPFITSSGVWNIPASTDDADLDDNKNPFLSENDFLIWKNSLSFRKDINTSKNTYAPNYLEKLLKPFAKNEKQVSSDYDELRKNEKVDLNQFLRITDNVMNVITNAIYYDLFRNPNRPMDIVCPNLNACSVNLIRKKIVSILRNKISGKLKWEIMLEIMLTNKSYSYGVICVVENEILVDINIIGVRPEDAIKLRTNDIELNTYADYDYNKENQSVLLPGNIKKMVSNYVNRQFYKPENSTKPIDLPNEYNCYGSHGQNKDTCENSYDSYYRKKPRGVWDRTCKVDSDCPFFKANKNYTNTFGGCVNGFCDMPIGIKSLSPRFYDINSQPLCYNCPNKSLNCCSRQNNPDYIFNEDLIVRKAYETDLKIRGLNLT